MNKLTLIFFLIPVSLSAQITYVDIDATGANDGSSWIDAYTNLAEALSNAEYGDSLWVAEGVYFPTTDENRHKHFTLKNGVRLFGGFAGFETQIAQRDWELHSAIMDGNIGNPNEATDNSYTVLYIAVSDSTTVVDGFTIQNGYADGVDSLATMCGGGAFINALDDIEIQPEIRNCVFINNYAELIGGGLVTDFNYLGLGPIAPLISLRIEGCLFQSNKALLDGGGAQILGNPFLRDLAIENSIFQGNEILDAIYGDGSALAMTPFATGSNSIRRFVIRGCQFIQNDSGEANRGTFAFTNREGVTELIIDSCLFKENITAFGAGSGFVFEESVSEPTPQQITIRNTVFEDNYGERSTVSIQAPDHDILIENCRFSRNETDDGGSSMGVTGNVKVMNCLFENNFQTSGSPGFCLGSGGIQDTMLLVNCTFIANESYNQYFCFFNSSPGQEAGPAIVENSILMSGEFEPLFDNGSYIQSFNGIDVFIDNCIVDQPIGSVPTDTILTLGNNIIFDLPVFVDSAGGDFRLAPCSPGVNMGFNEAFPGYLTDIDLQGQPRIQEDIIDIGAYELSALALAIDSTSGFICAGDTLGSITFEEPVSACAPYTITAPDGSVSTELFYGSLPEGSYTFILEDALGRSDTTTVVFTEPEALSVTAQITDATNGQSNDGSIEITEISGGVPPYELIWSHGQTGTLITGLEPTLYTLTLTDSLGCELIEYYLVGTITTTGTVSATEELVLYPNPANSFLNLILPEYRGGAFDLQITESNGRELYRQSGFRVSGKQEISLDISEFPAGTFFIRFSTSDSFAFARFVKIY